MDCIILTLATICFGISALTFVAIVVSIFPWRLEATVAAMQAATTLKPESNEPPAKERPKPTIDLEEAVYHVMRTKQTLARICLGLAALMIICSTVLIMTFGRPVEREGQKRKIEATKPMAIDATVNVRVTGTNAENTVNAVQTNSATGTATLPTPISETSGTNRSAKSKR